MAEQLKREVREKAQQRREGRAARISNGHVSDAEITMGSLDFGDNDKQPASCDVRYHVGQIIGLLAYWVSPPELLRTAVWPFYVAGCLAEPAQEAHFRGMVNALQPSNVFSTVRKVFEIMENAWRNRDVEEAANSDFATCFRNQGDLVLLV
ncbi:hypothetical protein F4776DRAFT_670461 [Hypoxylon sp. NC0597]|nr:hypothetical protein F4776DRAFT_670461 [Hypoxylon sp. NC0597]